MKVALMLLIALHGLVHLFGFAIAFNLMAANPYTQKISKTKGVLWLSTTLLFVSTAVLMWVTDDAWLIFFGMSVVLSQYLIFTNWADAKFGTIGNAIIIIAVFLQFGT